jgi:hypothetical protein
MPGLELVAGYLAAWVISKARRAAGRVDGEIDRALDMAMDRLYALVLDKLGADPALKKLQTDAKRRVKDPRTHTRVRLALEDAAEQDPRFAAELDKALQQVQDPRFAVELKQMLQHSQAFGAPGKNMPTEVRADRRGMAAGKNITTRVSGRGQIGHRFGALGAVMVVLIVAVTLIAVYYLHSHEGPSASEVEYQQQAFTTCQQAHGVLSADHSGEVLRPSLAAMTSGAGITDPRQMILINRTALLDMLENDLTQVKAAFAPLDQHDVPPSLRGRKSAVDQALAEWTTSFRQDIHAAQTTVQDGMNLAQLNPTFVEAMQGQGQDVSRTRLVAALSELAGKTCSI